MTKKDSDNQDVTKTPTAETETDAVDSDNTVAADSSTTATDTKAAETATSEAATSEANTSKTSTSAAKAASPDKKSASDQTTKASKPARSWVTALAFVLAICALIVTGAGYYKVQKLDELHQLLSQQTASLSQASQSNTSAREASTAQINRLQSRVDSQQQAVNEFQDRLTTATKQISSLGTNKKKDWILAEVEYLLRLANQRVLMERSPAGALTLLKSSDAALKETDDVSIYNVRKALAQDIAALEAVPKLDVDGTFLKLAAINERVNELRLLPVADHELPGTIDKITSEQLSESWQQDIKETWDGTLDKLGKLVVIQHRDEPIEPLLTPEQAYFLKQNLHLMLEQAQLSLLQGQQDPYNASLDKAKDWISTYFKNDTHATAMVQTINDLRSINVAPELPDISGSLKALKAYTAEVHKAEGQQ